MKKFAYVLSLDINFIGAANSSSDRYILLVDIINTNLAKEADTLPIQLDVSKLNSRLRALIEERKHAPLDIPDYKGRFTDGEIFVERNCLVKFSSYAIQDLTIK